MDVDPAASIPVEAILKLIVDKTGSQDVEKALEKQDQLFTKIETTAKSVGTHMERVGGIVTDLIGIGGLGAVVDKFMKIEQSAANVAVAMGKTTGGFGTYHPIGQEMLGVQSRTGVSVAEQEAGLRNLAMSVGLNARPGQLGKLAEVVAGYGQVTGMSSAQLSSILGPVLQASGRGATSGTVEQTMGELRQNLSMFPGSQLQAVAPGVAGLAQQVAPGAYASHKLASTAGIAAEANRLAQGSPYFHGENATNALQSINATAEGASTNPTMMAFLRSAGVSTWETFEGVNNPQYIEKVIAAVNRRYPGEQNKLMRRLVYRELGGGAQGAMAFEDIERQGGRIPEVTPGQVASGSMRALERGELSHALLRSTPQSQLSKLYGSVMGWLTESPLHAGLGAAGALFGVQALIKGSGSLLSGAAGLAPEAGALGIGGVLGGGAAVLGGLGIGELGKLYGIKPLEDWGAKTEHFVEHPIGTAESALQNLGIIGGGGRGGWHPSAKEVREGKTISHRQAEELAGAEQHNILKVLKETENKFGKGWLGSHWQTNTKERETAEKANAFIKERTGGLLGERGTISGDISKMREYETLGPSGYAAKEQLEASGKFKEAVERFGKTVEHGAGAHGAAYQNQGGAGAPAMASMTGSVPGMVMAAYLGSKGASSMASNAGGATPTYASYTGGLGGVSHWASSINRAAAATGVPANLIAGIMSVESGGNASAVSSAGAKGLMQLMNPGGLGVHNWQNGGENIMGGARELAKDLAAFPGSLGKAIAAYNAGIGGVQAHGESAAEGNYVQKVKAAMEQANLTVNVHVGGTKVEQHKTRVGGGIHALLT